MKQYPSDFLFITDKNLKGSINIQVETVNGSFELKVPFEIGEEWAKWANKLCYDIDMSMSFDEYLYSNFDDSAALELCIFCNEFYPELIKEI